MAKAIRCGLIARAKEIKAQRKKKRDPHSSNDEVDVAKKEAGQKKSDGKQWLVGCYGCGEDHHRSPCHALGPLG